MKSEQIKGDLAQEYSEAQLQAEESGHVKRFLDDALHPFEDTRASLAQPATELNSAKELLEYMMR